MSVKSFAGFYVDIDEKIDKLFLKFIWTCKGPRTARKILNEQHRRLHHQIQCDIVRKTQWSEIKSWKKKNPHKYNILFMTNMTFLCNRERIVFSKKWRVNQVSLVKNKSISEGLYM